MDTQLPFDVFLSHSSKDKAVVRALAERLRQDGLRVWFDAWEIRPGDSIPAKIEEGLERSRVLVLCMSENAFGSDWAQLESGTFRFRDPLNKERRFLPLRLDTAPIKGSVAQFAYINWLPEDREQSYGAVFEACRRSEQTSQLAEPLPPSAAASLARPQAAYALPIGTLRYVTARLYLEVKEDLSGVAGRIEVELHNDSDTLIKFHVVTAGNINGKAFDFNKVEFDGYAYARQSAWLISNRIIGIPLPTQKNLADPSIIGIFEYDLRYKAAEEPEFSRRTSRGVTISEWYPVERKPAGTRLEIPVRVVAYNEIEE